MRRYNNDNEMNTGRPWLNACARIISHLTIVLSCALAVIYFCDLYNRGEMGLLNNSTTRTMLLVLCILSLTDAVLHLGSLRLLRSIRKYFILKSRRER
jgi:hypothetical protein